MVPPGCYYFVESPEPEPPEPDAAPPAPPPPEPVAGAEPVPALVTPVPVVSVGEALTDAGPLLLVSFETDVESPEPDDVPALLQEAMQKTIAAVISKDFMILI